MAVNNEKELAQAVKEGQDTIVITKDLKSNVVTIKATGKVAWAVAIGAIGVAVTAVIASPSTGGVSSTIAVASAPAAVSILGLSATVSAISIAVAGGGVAVLNKLRKYEITEQMGDFLVLKRKK